MGRFSSPLGVVAVVGMGREARIAAADGVRTIVGGGRSFALEHGLARVLRERPLGVVSFGLCGALGPALKAGDLVIGTAVAGDGWRAPADPGWVERLAQVLPTAHRGLIAASDVIVGTAAQKAELRARTGAIGVDMESGIAARLAERGGVPFVALRSVSDPADRGLPPAACGGLGPGGEPQLRAVLSSLAQAPWQLPALVRTAFEAEAAFRALVRCRDLLGPGLGCPDFSELVLDVF
jgi:hopanoid-associated phosphorylase